MFTLLATPVIVDITVFSGFLIVTVAAPYPYNQSTLMAEHIIPQSVMAREHPELCDSVFNIVPVCKSCNQSKGTSFMPTWFKKQTTYSDERYWKIQHHQGKYMLNSLEEL